MPSPTAARKRTFTISARGEHQQIRATDLLIETAGRPALMVRGTAQGLQVLMWAEDGTALEYELTPTSPEAGIGWYQASPNKA